jgi:hypothetical protein
MSINYNDTASRESKRSAPGWMLLAVAIICVALISFPEVQSNLLSLVRLPGY